jgi:hypothetical protein
MAAAAKNDTKTQANRRDQYLPILKSRSPHHERYLVVTWEMINKLNSQRPIGPSGGEAGSTLSDLERRKD